MTALILPFPEQPPATCRGCRHHATWNTGAGYCHLFDIDIDLLEAADECPGWQPERTS